MIKKSIAPYRPLFRDRRISRAVLTVAISRLGDAPLLLCLLFTIADAKGSFSTAPAASAVFTLGAGVMPLQSRLIDRYGQRHILPAFSGLFLVFLAAAVTMGLRGVGSMAAWSAVCLFGGLTVPSFGPSMRAQWSQALEEAERQAAYSLDTAVEGVAYVVGSLVAAGILAVGQAWWGLVVTGVTVVIGAVGLTTSPFVPARRQGARGEKDGGLLGPLRSRGFRRLLVSMMLAGAGTFAMATVVPAMADAAGQQPIVGLIDAAAGLTYIAGGLWWGRRKALGRWQQQIALLTGAYLPFVIGCLLLPHLWSVGVFVAASGALMSPLLVVGYQAGDKETDPDQQTEAGAWVETVYWSGGALGTAGVGWLFAVVSSSTLFGLIAALFVLSALYALIGATSWPSRSETRRSRRRPAGNAG